MIAPIPRLERRWFRGNPAFMYPLKKDLLGRRSVDRSCFVSRRRLCFRRRSLRRGYLVEKRGRKRSAILGAERNRREGRGRETLSYLLSFATYSEGFAT